MRHPGDLLFSLPVFGAVGLLVLNDNWLKRHYGSVWTGKLSDLSGVFLFPLAALSVLEGARWVFRRQPWEATGPEINCAVIVTIVGFAAVKLVPAVSDTYAAVIGGIRWVAKQAIGGGVYSTIQIAKDPTDILVFPILLASRALARSARL